jgi:hypothetical protein
MRSCPCWLLLCHVLPVCFRWRVDTCASESHDAAEDSLDAAVHAHLRQPEAGHANEPKDEEGTPPLCILVCMHVPTDLCCQVLVQGWW